MSAKFIAIEKAFNYATNKGFAKVAILSDSKSGAYTLSQGTNSIAKRILKQLYPTNTLFSIHFIPSHSGIEEKDKVDLAAKQALSDGPTLTTPWSRKDAVNEIENKLWKEWNILY